MRPHPALRATFSRGREKGSKETGMIGEAVFFWIFSATLIGSALAVILARNPVHSVLFLILAFFNAAGLFILLGAEFVAMILVIVYVGAVAVLFLFVVMMLDINFLELRRGINTYLPFGIFLAAVMLIELGFLVFNNWVLSSGAAQAISAPTPSPAHVTNTRALGQLLYTHYLYVFQVAGLILLVAMIGAIVLTLRQRTGVRRQRAATQVARRREDVLVITQVPSGAGAPVSP
jgi:NADH-quinone oxidoreductase subunit J